MGSPAAPLWADAGSADASIARPATPANAGPICASSFYHADPLLGNTQTDEIGSIPVSSPDHESATTRASREATPQRDLANALLVALSPGHKSVGSTASADAARYIGQPLVREIYTADPSARVYDGTLYIYPSHDIEAGIPDDDLGSQYAMRDYRVLRMEQPGGPVTIGPVALDVSDVPWAREKMWAPDAIEKDGTHYFYFPAVDHDGIFRIGVATGTDPMGPFTAEPEPIPGSFSMDPNIFTDDDGTSYLYFGGIWASCSAGRTAPMIRRAAIPTSCRTMPPH